MDTIKWTDKEQQVEFVPIFVIGFEEELERGVIMTTPAYKLLVDDESDLALAAIDAAVDMLMQRRDQIEKRELH